MEISSSPTVSLSLEVPSSVGDNGTALLSQSHSQSTATPKPAYILELENAVYEKGLINVIDPIDGKSNICVAVETAGYVAIHNSLLEGYKLFQLMCEGFAALYRNPSQTAAEGLKLMKTLFLNTCSKAPGKGNVLIPYLTSQKTEMDVSASSLFFIHPHCDCKTDYFGDVSSIRCVTRSSSSEERLIMLF